MLHHPPHILLDDTWYQITASTYQNRPVLASPESKQLAGDLLQTLINEFGFRLKAWVILNNHYHLLLKSKRGVDLPLFIRRYHGRISFDLNRKENVRDRQVWHNYWDTCIRDEAGFWMRFNYIHHNPVKHGYVSRMEDWPYSSYNYYLKAKGAEWLADVLRRYPVVDFTDYFDRDFPNETG